MGMGSHFNLQKTERSIVLLEVVLSLSLYRHELDRDMAMALCLYMRCASISEVWNKDS